MCGIAGIFNMGDDAPAPDRSLVEAMNHVQRHRGPDDEGIYADDHCVLGHRRLAIIDLSSDGHQPFAAEDGRYQMVYNGEVYNYIELREELEKCGHVFRTKTDTEVLLCAWLEYGPRCLDKLNGMFAFAIYDRQEQALFLARDRVGIKPLYYLVADNAIYFASEIKALRLVPGVSFTPNQQSLFDFLVFNRTDVHDESFVEEIKRIPKGHYAVIDCNGASLSRWWNPEALLQRDNTGETRETACERIEELLISSVKLRMRSDVPVGSCLSGGLDSSILTGILFQHYPEIGDKYATFTASFPDHPIDETSYVDSLNERYPFTNTRTFPKGDAALEALEKFVYTNDEPTTNPSFYSQYEVMRLAKANGVTVLLDGQGGDETFAGYQYFHGFYMYGLLRQWRLPSFARELSRVVARSQHKSAYQTLAFQLLPGSQKKRALRRTLPYIRRDFFDEYIESSRIYNGFFDAPDLNTSLVRHFQYKLEHLLRMEDRNSMAFSLESRVPYLDYRLTEYTLGLPADWLIKAGETKHLQKQALGKYTVDSILDRTDKIGFGTPSDQWMASPEWQDATRQNYEELCEAFPDIFIKDSALPAAAIERWKINQLGVWNGIDWKG